jgi:hypothetical protein
MIEQNVGQAEDGCVSADPETKSEHGHSRESRAFEQHASRIAKILGEEVHPGPVSTSVSRTRAHDTNTERSTATGALKPSRDRKGA